MKRRLWFSVTVDEDLHKAVGHRLGKERATEAEIRNSIEGVVEVTMDDWYNEWLTGEAPDDDGE